jgi:plastocyanin
MRRAALVAALLAVALSTTADARRRAPAPARVMVEAREFGLTLSRSVLAAGPAIVQLAVRGEDGHDLAIAGAGSVRRIAETRPGRTADWRGTLKPGRYRLYCSLPGHAAAGMRATLRVR